MLTYHYRILQYIHDFAMEEFINVGVAIYIPHESKIIYKIQHKYNRAENFFKNYEYGFNPVNYSIFLKDLDKWFKVVSDKIYHNQIYKHTKTPHSQYTRDVFNELMDPEGNHHFQWSEVKLGVTSNPERRTEEIFSEFIK